MDAAVRGSGGSGVAEGVRDHGVAASGTWKGVWSVMVPLSWGKLERFAKGGQKLSLGRLPCGSS